MDKDLAIFIQNTGYVLKSIEIVKKDLIETRVKLIPFFKNVELDVCKKSLDFVIPFLEEVIDVLDLENKIIGDSDV